jgi:hypothetical protein
MRKKARRIRWEQHATGSAALGIRGFRAGKETKRTRHINGTLVLPNRNCFLPSFHIFSGFYTV